MDNTISEKVWACAQWEIHNARYCIQEIEGAVEACAQRWPVPRLLFERTQLTTKPKGIDMAVKEVKRIIKEFKDRRMEGMNMTPEEIHARINDERRGWANLF